jgi:hypothetical protein
MNRADLLDNARVSAERRERVTLTLHPLHGRGDRVVYGRLIAVAEHYTGRDTLVLVLDRDDQPALVVGLTMIKDFAVGRPAPTAQGGPHA